MGYKSVSYKSILLLLLVISFSLSVYAVTPTVTVFKPTGIGTFTGSIDVNFVVADGVASATFDGNVWIRLSTPGSTRYNIVNDNNILDINIGVGKLNCTNQAAVTTTGMYCGVRFDTRNYANVDGNYFIDVNVTDDGGLTGNGSSITFMIDNNAPTLTLSSGKYNTWKNSGVALTFTCSDGTGAGCGYLNYMLDQNALTGVLGGAPTTVSYTANSATIDFNSDGNYFIDFNATDYAGITSDINRVFVLIDTHAPTNVGAYLDFTADVNQTGASSTDRFVAIDQNITGTITRTADTIAETTSWSTVKFMVTDINSADTRLYNTVNLGSGVYRFDYNVGNFDINFTQKYVTMSVTDSAGNDSNTNILNPIIPYTMTRPSGLDNNSTNFQTVTNFEVIPYMVFAKSGLGKITFTQDINLGTYAQAVKLMQLETALTITTAAIGKDKTVTINSSVFSDINKSARISVYGLFTGLALTPRIIKDDANCGNFCTKIDYNSETGQLDFNVSQFSTYNSDSNAPVISNVSPTTTQVGSSFNLSLTTNEAATCRYGTTDVNYDSMGNTTSQGTSHSWALSNQVNGTITYYFQCRDLVSFDSNTSKAVTVALSGASSTPSSTVTPTPTPTPTPSPAPAPEVVVVATETNVIETAIAGETVRVPIETAGIGVTQVQIELANAISNASVTLSVIETPPAETGSLAITVVPATGGMGETVAPKVYQYLQVEKQNITNEDITKATIGFKVEKSWLQANGLNASDVALYRFTNEWNALSTSFAYETTDFAYYTAVTPGFSYFAIGEKPKVEAAPMPRVITEEPTVPEEEIVPTGLPTLPAFIPEAAPTDYSSLVAIIIIIIVVGIAVYLINEKKL